MPLFAKAFAESDETKDFPNGHEAIVTMAGKPIGLTTFRPGWRWSNDIRPIVGTELCQSHHKGYVLAGRLHAETPEGSSIDLGPGDVFEIPPGHDGWVVGDEPCVMLDWGERVREYSEPANESAGAVR